MAGEGQRFKDAGYTFPKPLITIRNQPMIAWVVKNLNLPQYDHHFIAQKAHAEQYPIAEMCARLVPQAIVTTVAKTTQGAACTVLQGLQEAPCDLTAPLLIANCDQILSWQVDEFLTRAETMHLDGLIPVFESVHPKWSYVQITPKLDVTEVMEKFPLSCWATCGVYYFRTAQSFIEGTRQMIAQEKLVKGEFYVAPVYNELIAQGARVQAYPVKDMWGLGTPEDLEEFKLHVCRG